MVKAGDSYASRSFHLAKSRVSVSHNGRARLLPRESTMPPNQKLNLNLNSFWNGRAHAKRILDRSRPESRGSRNGFSLLSKFLRANPRRFATLNSRQNTERKMHNNNNSYQRDKSTNILRILIVLNQYNPSIDFSLFDYYIFFILSSIFSYCNISYNLV